MKGPGLLVAAVLLMVAAILLGGWLVMLGASAVGLDLSFLDSLILSTLAWLWRWLTASPSYRNRD